MFFILSNINESKINKTKLNNFLKKSLTSSTISQTFYSLNKIKFCLQIIIILSKKLVSVKIINLNSKTK